jgi:hypothetical protein
MEDLNFCPVCGKNVPPGTTYCPACGCRLGDPASEMREEVAEKRMGVERITIATVLILIYSIPMVLLGIWIFISAGSASNIIFNDPDFAWYADQLISYGYTASSLTSLIEAVGLMAIVAGSVGVAAAVLALTRRLWIIAMMLCMLSALIGTVTIFGLILGLIAFWMLYRARPAFEN